jgi:hypothetical protein
MRCSDERREARLEGEAIPGIDASSPEITEVK